jgi:hypothetical protein
MKKLLYILQIIALAAVSCKEDTLDYYSGENYIHFTPGVNDVPEVTYNFALDGQTTAETEVSVPVEIRLWGRFHQTEDISINVATVKTIDWSSLSVNSRDTLSVSGEYYVDLAPAVFQKQQPVCTLWVKVKRKPELLSTNHTIQIKLEDPDKWFVVAPAKYSVVNLHVIDEIPSQPVWWETTQSLGAYSPVKYRLFNIFMNKLMTDISAYTADGFKELVGRYKEWLQNNMATYPEAAEVYDSIP